MGLKMGKLKGSVKLPWAPAQFVTEMEPPSSSVQHEEETTSNGNSFGDNLAASQIEMPPSLPGQTPPSTVTEPLFSSSIVGTGVGTSQVDIPGTVR